MKIINAVKTIGEWAEKFHEELPKKKNQLRFSKHLNISFKRYDITYSILFMYI